MSDSPPSPQDPSADSEQTRQMQSHQTEALRQVGAEVGEFRLLRRLGRGGMAEVWLAEQMTLKRNVALKLLRPELMEDETYVARFQTEAKAAAGLNHPNIVQVYTVGADKGQHFIAQEYVHGQTLKSLLQRRGPLDLQVALMIIRQVASALDAAGEQGIVHRDIKPENIMLTRKGEAKVADFGLAQLQGGDRLKLTQEGITMGTPLYMSPEQVSGKNLDQRSDIYSLGITCYHMLAGRPPFEGDNAVSVAVKHLHEKAAPLSSLRPDLPTAVCQLVHRMIAKQPEDRYQEARTIVNDVRKLAKAIRLGEPVEETLISGENRTASFPVRRPAIVLPLACLALFLGSAAIGWSVRVRPAETPSVATEDHRIPIRQTAREQFIDAMFQIDNEHAFLAVIDKFPLEQIWVRRAHEQLALLYLKDNQRWPDAEAALQNLPSLEPSNPELKAESRVGLAYLFAMRGNLARANDILIAEQDEFQKHLSGSWKQLEDDVRQLVREKDRKTAAAPSTTSNP